MVAAGMHPPLAAFASPQMAAAVRQPLPAAARIAQLHEPVLSALRTGHHLIAGVDEAGAGPLAGPVVAAAVLLNPYHALPSPEFLDDSKRMTARRRAAVFRELVSHPAVMYSVSVVSATEIDKLNILRARLCAMSRAVEELPLRAGLLFVDGDRLLPEVAPRVCQHAVIGGDASVSVVAMASVVAKEVRDGIMRDMDVRFPGYGFARHVGYPTREHLQRLRELGPCEIHRRSYRPVREAEALVCRDDGMRK